MSLLRKISVLLLIAFFFTVSGCIQFTQHDYELQEKAYQKEQKEKEGQAKDNFQYRW